jgi:hypothetical protein
MKIEVFADKKSTTQAGAKAFTPLAEPLRPAKMKTL